MKNLKKPVKKIFLDPKKMTTQEITSEIKKLIPVKRRNIRKEKNQKLVRMMDRIVKKMVSNLNKNVLEGNETI